MKKKKFNWLLIFTIFFHLFIGFLAVMAIFYVGSQMDGNIFKVCFYAIIMLMIAKELFRVIDSFIYSVRHIK